MTYAYALTGRPVSLADFSTRPTGDLTREPAEPLFSALVAQLADLQELLTASGHHAVLVVLQGMDTSGKSGTVKAVASGLNPAGCHVIAFKKPTVEELEHDFLWRVHRHTPGKGTLAFFDRSHYEDVLIGRVRNLVPEEVWQARYEHINAFERLLIRDCATIVIKLFLHLSIEEQAERLRAREREVDKRWKLNVADYVERERWDQYTHAYEVMLQRCASVEAPWYVVPSDKKWFRNLAVVETLVARLSAYESEWRDAMRARGARNYQELLDQRGSNAGRR